MAGIYAARRTARSILYFRFGTVFFVVFFVFWCHLSLNLNISEIIPGVSKDLLKKGTVDESDMLERCHVNDSATHLITDTPHKD